MPFAIQIKNILKKPILQILEEKIPFSILNEICVHQYKKYISTNMYITPLMQDIIPNGIPISIKDNFLTLDIRTTAASRMLENFIPPYNATLVTRLQENGFQNYGKTNMDEFAMGSSGVSSYFGSTKSIWYNHKGEVFSPGGSSSGSAVSVASGAVFASICTDTSGSIRLPASYMGIVGFKPTYGLLSRYGIIPLAESLDHPGFLTRFVDDAKYLFNCTIGKDKEDLTTVDYKPIYSHKKKFAIIKEIYDADPIINKKIKEVEECFTDYERKEYSVPELDIAIAIYVILSRGECASNLQRYDGLKFGYAAQNINNLEDHYIQTRSEGFGLEVQRRIMIGGFVTSSENIQVYVHKAQSLRQYIKEQIFKILSEVDFIIMPTALGAITLEESQNINLQDPMKMQKCDLFTVVANLCGFPAISVPIGIDENGSPFGIDLMAQPFQDLQLLEFADIIEKKFNIHEILINKITTETEK
jgi:aspartyl-tRNA(Asn)/glutamyl-tRNA(Gln) amidotransferase subunit A